MRRGAVELIILTVMRHSMTIYSTYVTVLVVDLRLGRRRGFHQRRRIQEPIIPMSSTTLLLQLTNVRCVFSDILGSGLAANR